MVYWEKGGLVQAGCWKGFLGGKGSGQITEQNFENAVLLCFEGNARTCSSAGTCTTDA